MFLDIISYKVIGDVCMRKIIASLDIVKLFSAHIFGWILKDIDVIVDKVNDFRFKQLNLEPIDDELKSTWISDKKELINI